MAQIIGGIATSHIPAIGKAIAQGLQDQPYWKPFFDGYDPVPGPHGGISRTAREITAMRRTHDLRRRIALLGERVPATLRGDVDIRRCLSEASNTTMTILHLVHEVNAADFAAKMTDFSSAAVTRRWRAGESDIATSLAHPRWLAPPPRLSGIVVHEVRGGMAAPPR